MHWAGSRWRWKSTLAASPSFASRAPRAGSSRTAGTVAGQTRVVVASVRWHHAGCGQLGDAQQRWALYRYQGAAEQGYVPALLLTAYFSLAQPDLVHDEHSRTLAKLQAGEKLLLVSPNEERFLTTTFGGTAYQKRVQSMRRKLNASQPEVDSAHPHGPVVPSLAALEAHLAGQ